MEQICKANLNLTVSIASTIVYILSILSILSIFFHFIHFVNFIHFVQASILSMLPPLCTFNPCFLQCVHFIQAPSNVYITSLDHTPSTWSMFDLTSLDCSRPNKTALNALNAPNLCICTALSSCSGGSGCLYFGSQWTGQWALVWTSSSIH